jgi:hypothetical protein
METRSRSVLDAPPEPVIGLAEGETRWRGMTAPAIFLRHCEEPTGPRKARPDDRLRDEAIPGSASGGMDCFASLAMTSLIPRDDLAFDSRKEQRISHF